MKKPWNVPSLIATLFIKRNMIMSQIQRVRVSPYVDTNPHNVACWHLNMLKMIKQVRGDPYWWTKKRSTKLISEFRDCHMAEHLRVQELVKKIENHPHRSALHADLQETSVYNPFSKKSKEMIRELDNVELFQLCETTPKVQFPRMSSLLESRYCVLHLRAMPWSTANPEESLTN